MAVVFRPPAHAVKIRFVLAALGLACSSAKSAALTASETEWLAAALPVLNYAAQQQLPVDVVVQPQDTPGAPPLATGFVEGRCKLVLSMRGNPRLHEALAGVARAHVPAVIEAMTAHEIGHCWRYVHGSWQRLPASFVEADGELPTDAERLERWRREMRMARREEGFADLVGLAWTLQQRPEQYAAVHAWFTAVRHDQPVPGSHHDTRAWIRLAGDTGALAGPGNLFERARVLWQRGLLADD